MAKGFWFLMRHHWRVRKSVIIYTVLEELLGVGATLLMIIVPKFIIDELLGAKQLDVIFLYVTVLLLGTWLCNMGRSACGSLAFRNMTISYQEFSIYMTEKIMESDFALTEHASFMDLRAKAEKFLYAEGWGFGQVTTRGIQLIGHILTFISIVAIVFTLNRWMVLVFIGLVALNALQESITKKVMVQWDLEKAPHERRSSYYMNMMIDPANGKEFRIYGLQHWMIARQREKLAALREFYKKMTGRTINSSLMSTTIAFLQQAAAYVYLVFRVVAGAIGIGDFTLYLNAINNFSNTMRQIMSILIDMRRYEGYYTAAEQFLNIPPMQRTGTLQPSLDKPIIMFENVSFRYPNQENWALRNLNITLHPSEKLSVVGENGAGKTTFVKLMTRMYEPTEGRILYNGVDIRELEYDAYMKAFGVVFQDYKLFAFSMFENVALADSTNSHEQKAEEAMVHAGLGDKIAGFSRGIHTPIYKYLDDTGVELSGGEGQKLALARALYKNAPVVILDEPTAALDPRAEYELYKRFDDLVMGKSAIYISHRLSSSRFCDKVAVFHNGELVEFGSHDELIKQSGRYAELFDMQAQFYVDVA